MLSTGDVQTWISPILFNPDDDKKTCVSNLLSPSPSSPVFDIRIEGFHAQGLGVRSKRVPQGLQARGFQGKTTGVGLATTHVAARDVVPISAYGLAKEAEDHYASGRFVVPREACR